MDGHINLNIGNVIFIGGVAGLTVIFGLAAIHMLSSKNVPVLSPTARGMADFIKTVAA